MVRKIYIGLLGWNKKPHPLHFQQVRQTFRGRSGAVVLLNFEVCVALPHPTGKAASPPLLLPPHSLGGAAANWGPRTNSSTPSPAMLSKSLTSPPVLQYPHLRNVENNYAFIIHLKDLEICGWNSEQGTTIITLLIQRKIKNHHICKIKFLCYNLNFYLCINISFLILILIIAISV